MSALLRTPVAQMTVIPVDGPEIDIKDHRVRFEVTRTADQEPNAGKATVFNLGEQTRALIGGTIRPSPLELLSSISSSPYKTGAEIQESAELVAQRYQYAYVRLMAGFLEGRAPAPVLREVLSGVSSRATSVQSGVDWTTTIEFADSLAGRTHAVVNRTFERGEAVFGAVQHLVRVLGLRSGNVTESTWRGLSDVQGLFAAKNAGAFQGNIFAGGGPLSGEQYFGSPYTPEGDPADQLTQLLDVYRVRWIADEGAVWLLGPGGYIPGAPVDLGTPRAPPEETEDGLLIEVVQNALVRPGIRVNLRSARVQGVFFCQAVRHFGDTFGELLSTVEVVPLEAIPGVV